METRFKKKVLIGTGAVIAAIVGIAGGVAATGVVDGDEQPITGDALAKASAAALEHTGGGVVSETEVDDEDSYYEVEITLADGSQVDVQLDESFNVVGAETDDETEGDDAD